MKPGSQSATYIIFLMLILLLATIVNLLALLKNFLLAYLWTFLDPKLSVLAWTVVDVLQPMVATVVATLLCLDDPKADECGV